MTMMLLLFLIAGVFVAGVGGTVAVIVVLFLRRREKSQNEIEEE